MRAEVAGDWYPSSAATTPGCWNGAGGVATGIVAGRGSLGEERVRKTVRASARPAGTTRIRTCNFIRKGF